MLYDNVKSIEESNESIKELINYNKPFMVARVGVVEGKAAYLYNKHNDSDKLPTKLLDEIENRAGIYYKDDYEVLNAYFKLYIQSLENSDLLCFMYCDGVWLEQNYFQKKYSLPTAHSRALEPFYILNDAQTDATTFNTTPWTHSLINKKVLIISPFVDSFKKQIENGFRMLPEKDDQHKQIFLDDQQFIFYKTYMTMAGNHIHGSWIETYDIMCKDISVLDFDIALVSCGGYGLPLCHHIKTLLNKSAIYIGGGLQLLFGVMGNRWENLDFWKDMMNNCECKFIRPSLDEMIPNSSLVEGSTYW